MAAAAPTPAPAGLARLRQEFGQGLAEDVLVSVLEMFQGNVQETINFLRAGQGDYIDDPNAAKTPKLPTDYFTPPAGWSASLVAQHARPRTPAVSMKEFFLRDTTTFQEHFNFLAPESTQRSLYTAVLSLLLRSGVELNHGIKVRALTAALGTKNNQLVDLLLGFNLMFDLPVIVACLRFLDLPRRVVAWEKKLVRLERQGSAKSTTIVQIRGRLTEVRNLMMPDQKTSVNGAMCRRFRKWAKTLPKATLEFVALSLPKELWAEFADFVHPSPNCFALDYFLPVCFGVPPAADTMVAACSNLNANNVEQLIRSYDIPYSHIRRNCPQLTPLIKERVATYEKFSTVLWWYEELASPAVDLIIEARLDRGDELDLPYGKLMERLLFFKMNGVRFYAKLIPIAEKRIRSISLVLDRPVMVIGDASFSMDVAIRTSTIIASLLCALAHADLRFFNDKVLNPNLLPTSAEDVIEVASTTKADGLTAPAVALADLFAERRVVKYFVVVTDEIENEAHDGEFFAQLFYKYYTTVYPARIVMVSFLEDPGSSAKGRMVSALEQLGIPPLQFRLDGSRPDLTKIDSLLGLLSSESDFFSQQAAEIASQLDTGAPLDAVLEKARDQVDFQVGPHAETDESGASTSSSSSSSVPAPFRPELE